MYLAPWQIFAIGCVCGVFITLLIMIFLIIHFVRRAGVNIEKEEEDRGK